MKPAVLFDEFAVEIPDFERFKPYGRGLRAKGKGKPNTRPPARPAMKKPPLATPKKPTPQSFMESDPPAAPTDPQSFEEIGARVWSERR